MDAQYVHLTGWFVVLWTPVNDRVRTGLKVLLENFLEKSLKFFLP